jgi:hypothetical protein
MDNELQGDLRKAGFIQQYGFHWAGSDEPSWSALGEKPNISESAKGNYVTRWIGPSEGNGDPTVEVDEAMLMLADAFYVKPYGERDDSAVSFMEFVQKTRGILTALHDSMLEELAMEAEETVYTNEAGLQDGSAASKTYGKIRVEDWIRGQKWAES